MQRVFDNPQTGERIVIRQSGAETGGELLVFDVLLQPGAHVPATHTHPRQQEHFTVIEGRVRFRAGGRWILARTGDSVTIGPGTPHWFGNADRSPAQLRVEARPALRLEELFETNFQQSRSQVAMWQRLADLALILLDFRHEVGIPNVPTFLVTIVLTPLAWLRGRGPTPPPVVRHAS
jgi:quercetin dioxygenase-like cupin family protein